jgi:Rad3-related DNA helicase
MNNRKIDSAFPFDSYRDHQRDILHTAADALFDDDTIDTIVIDAPTGIGKSGINMALGQLAESAFYTTPEKKLREQLDTDPAFEKMHQPLRGRQDYICDIKTKEKKEYSCKTCPINRSDDDSCHRQGASGCIYWRDKEAAMAHDIATLTFSYLIIDNYLPVCVDESQYDHTGNGQLSLTDFGADDDDDDVDVDVDVDDDVDDPTKRRISFSDRELLIIDEAHTLEEQVASLHAGFGLSAQKLSTKSLSDFDSVDTEAVSVDETDGIYQQFADGIEELTKYDGISLDDITVDMIEDLLIELRTTASQRAESLKHVCPSDEDEKEQLSNIIDDLESVAQSIEIIFTDRKQGTPWVIDVTSYSVDGDEDDEETRYAAKLKPVYVDTFLQRFVWQRADKVVLSTATMPYRSDPDQWLERIGLDPTSTCIISRPMPFPAKNRKVVTSSTVTSFSNNAEEKHWGDICAGLEDIYQKHAPEKGLIHTVSYDRAESFHDSFPDRTLLDEGEREMESVIEDWQDSDDAHMLLSPRMMEGADLGGDMCRWQVLAKAPYKPRGDPRVKHLLNEKNDWRWYKETAARRAIQAAGRAVRSKDDYATYYVLDAAIENVLTSNTMPDWFAEAVV